MTSAWTPNNDSSSIMFRLDPEPTLRKLQLYLLGMIEVVEQDETGDLHKRTEQVGEPRVNKVGYYTIMGHVETVVNSMTVQGNISDEQYNEFMGRFHEGLSNDLWENSFKYGINDSSYNGIIHMITNLVGLFITRTIANKERESLGQSHQVSERVTSSPGPKNPVRGMIPGL